jgi:hypothetical protein
MLGMELGASAQAITMTNVSLTEEAASAGWLISGLLN